MRATAIRNNKGMTLVEVLVALLISLMVFLALMQTALVSIDSNMRNVLRDEAVRVADTRMNTIRSLPYETVVSDAGALTDCSSACPTDFPTTGWCAPAKKIRGITDFRYCTNLASTDLGVDTKQVTITVGWKWKGEDYRHSIQTIRRRL